MVFLIELIIPWEEGGGAADWQKWQLIARRQAGGLSRILRITVAGRCPSQRRVGQVVGLKEENTDELPSPCDNSARAQLEEQQTAKPHKYYHAPVYNKLLGAYWHFGMDLTKFLTACKRTN